MLKLSFCARHYTEVNFIKRKTFTMHFKNSYVGQMDYKKKILLEFENENWTKPESLVWHCYLTRSEWGRILKLSTGVQVGSESPLSNLTNGSSTGSLKGAGRPSAKRTQQQQQSLAEECVALDSNSPVVVTGVNPLDSVVPWDALGWQQRALGSSPKKASSSSLSLLGSQDCSR